MIAKHAATKLVERSALLEKQTLLLAKAKLLKRITELATNEQRTR